jgi:hypothetical protein
VIVAALPLRNDGQIQEWYNVDSTFVAWRSSLTPEQARDAITNGDGLAQLDNLTAGKRDSLLWTFGGNTDPSNATQRTAIANLCGTQNTLKAAILAAQKRAATRAEAIFATGTGSDAVPGLLGWEGQLSVNDVSTALNTY